MMGSLRQSIHDPTPIGASPQQAHGDASGALHPNPSGRGKISATRLGRLQIRGRIKLDVNVDETDFRHIEIILRES